MSAHAHVGGAKPPTHRNLGLTPSWHIGALAAAAAVALALGVWSMTQVDPLRIGGAGLIGVLPPAYFVALALSLAGFVASLSLRRLVPALLTWQLLVTVVILDGADPIIHGLPRLEASFRHLGIADTIGQRASWIRPWTRTSTGPDSSTCWECSPGRRAPRTFWASQRGRRWGSTSSCSHRCWPWHGG